MAWSPALKKVKFVPFSMKAVKAHYEAFTNMLLYDARENDKKAFVQILGIYKHDMKLSLREKLLKECPEIAHVSSTILTERQGRFRVYADKSDIAKVEKWLSAEIENMWKTLPLAEKVPGFVGPPRLVNTTSYTRAQVQDLLQMSEEVFANIDDEEEFPSLVIRQPTRPVTPNTPGAWQVPPAVTPTITQPGGASTSRTTLSTRDSTTQRLLQDIQESLQTQKDRMASLENKRAEEDERRKQFVEDLADLKETLETHDEVISEVCGLMKELAASREEMQNAMEESDRRAAEDSKAMKSEIGQLRADINKMMVAFQDFTSIALSTRVDYHRDPSTPPRVLRSMNDETHPESDASTMAPSPGRNSPNLLSPSASPTQTPSLPVKKNSDQKRLPESSPDKRSRRAAQRKSAQTARKKDVASGSSGEDYDEEDDHMSVENRDHE
eukprot:scaffold5139_cov100-Cylindrotheca_fusiformis.AAC.2